MKCTLRIFNLCELFLFFVCIQNVYEITVAAGDVCELPGGARGECVDLTACVMYVTLLKESTTTQLGLRYIQGRRCGFEGLNFKVCCPTVTEVPYPKTRTNFDASDYVDKLPDPDTCARLRIDPAPGPPVQYSPVHPGTPSRYRRDILPYGGHSHDEDDRFRGAGFASGAAPVIGHGGHSHGEDDRGRGEFSASGGAPVIGHGGHSHDEDDRGPRAQVASSGASPVIGHDAQDRIVARPDYNEDLTPNIFGGLPVITPDAQYSNENPPPSISGGYPVIRPDKAQWMALLAYKRSPSLWECGGSIITKRHVLTAAHCIRESLYVVRVGEVDLATIDKEYNPIDFYIKKKIPHEQYTKFHNDIAILVLDGTIPIEDSYISKYIAPVCLPKLGFPYEKRGPLSTFITGWGETENNGERPTNLLYAYLNILGQDACKSVYPHEALTIDERVFCAGDPGNGRDACNGDSGGPLIAQYYLPDYEGIYYYQVGLISYGYRCSAHRYTGVYTNITHFMPWILEKVTGKTEPQQWTVTTQAPNYYPNIFGQSTRF